MRDRNRLHPNGARAERRRSARAKRRLMMARTRLAVVTPLVGGRSPAYAAYRAGFITRKQARLLGVVGAVLYRGPR
jgi:hypothetical protein